MARIEAAEGVDLAVQSSTVADRNMLQLNRLCDFNQQTCDDQHRTSCQNFHTKVGRRNLSLPRAGIGAEIGDRAIGSGLTCLEERFSRWANTISRARSRMFCRRYLLVQ